MSRLTKQLPLRCIRSSPKASSPGESEALNWTKKATTAFVGQPWKSQEMAEMTQRDSSCQNPSRDFKKEEKLKMGEKKLCSKIAKKPICWWKEKANETSCSQERWWTNSSGKDGFPPVSCPHHTGREHSCQTLPGAWGVTLPPREVPSWEVNVQFPASVHGGDHPDKK